MRSSAWVGWGGDDQVVKTPADLFRDAPLADAPGPPRLRHVAAFSCCAWCSDALPKRLRCTTDPEALAAASSEDLCAGRVENVCVMDADEEVERRISFPDFRQPRERRPGLLERLRGSR